MYHSKSWSAEYESIPFAAREILKKAREVRVLNEAIKECRIVNYSGEIKKTHDGFYYYERFPGLQVIFDNAVIRTSTDSTQSLMNRYQIGVPSDEIERLDLETTTRLSDFAGSLDSAFNQDANLARVYGGKINTNIEGWHGISTCWDDNQRNDHFAIELGVPLLEYWEEPDAKALIPEGRDWDRYASEFFEKARYWASYHKACHHPEHAKK